MPARAAQRAEWGARITNDDWGVHPTIAYAVMISEAFFETDPAKLVNAALAAIPPEGPFHEGMVDVIRWHAEFARRLARHPPEDSTTSITATRRAITKRRSPSFRPWSMVCAA
jgi:hypothetical protein